MYALRTGSKKKRTGHVSTLTCMQGYESVGQFFGDKQVPGKKQRHTLNNRCQRKDMSLSRKINPGGEYMQTLASAIRSAAKLPHLRSPPLTYIDVHDEAEIH